MPTQKTICSNKDKIDNDDDIEKNNNNDDENNNGNGNDNDTNVDGYNNEKYKRNNLIDYYYTNNNNNTRNRSILLIMITLQQYIQQWVHWIKLWLLSIYEMIFIGTGPTIILISTDGDEIITPSTFATNNNDIINEIINKSSNNNSNNNNHHIENTISVRRAKQPLAEGGFSLVFKASFLSRGREKNTPSTNSSSTNNSTNSMTYALKQIHCHDRSVLDSCRQEIAVHLAIQESILFQHRQTSHHQSSASATNSPLSNTSILQHPYLCMPLLGYSLPNTVSSSSNNNHCYMLFPFIPRSLRQEVNQRIFYENNGSKSNNTSSLATTSPSSPWHSPEVVLYLYQQITQAVSFVHQAGYTHCDIKLENILLQPIPMHHQQQYNQQQQQQRLNIPPPKHFPYRPVIMDFGSALPTLKKNFLGHTRQEKRRELNAWIEYASINTTMSYRPPELFPGSGGFVTLDGDGGNGIDYTKVDVWMLGCTFYAILFGASPFELEFQQHRQQQQRRGMSSSMNATKKSSTSSGPNHGIQIVPPSALRVLGKIPIPPPSSNDNGSGNNTGSSLSSPSCWYQPIQEELLQNFLIQYVLKQNPIERPTIDNIQISIQQLYTTLLQKSNRSTNAMNHITTTMTFPLSTDTTTNDNNNHLNNKNNNNVNRVTDLLDFEDPKQILYTG